MNTNDNGHEIIEVENTESLVPVREQILAPLTLADYSQFLYETNFGGEKGAGLHLRGDKHTRDQQRYLHR